ncbi:DUF6049 family protein [Blastococcus jejuensis]|uniref:DUF6049 family protein n=1 Tax=Blastococcus jejuensis TaxID=351224 RepID=A0ABP6PFU0_9ACTN
MTRTALLRAAVAPLLATALGVAALGPAVSVAAASPLVPVLAAPSDDDATDPDRPVRIDVGRFEPRTLTPGQTVRVTGTLTNSTDSTITDLGMRLQRGEVMRTRAELAAAAADPDPATTVLPVFEELPGELEPGGELDFDYTIPSADLQLVTDGVYPVLLNVNGTVDGDQRRRVGELATFVIQQSVLPATPTTVAWLWPVVERTHRDASGDFVDDDLAAVVSDGGRLDRALSVIERLPDTPGPDGRPVPTVPVTLAIDPALVEELTVMAAGPYDVGGEDDAGTGTDAAIAFLDRLRELAADHPVVALPYGDVDADALDAAGLTDVVLRSLPGPVPAGEDEPGDPTGEAAPGDATTPPTPTPTPGAGQDAADGVTSPGPGARILTDALEVEPRTDLVWPAGGTARTATLATLQAHGVTRAVLGTDGLTGGARAAGVDGTTATVRSQVTTPGGPLDVLVADSTLGGVAGEAEHTPGGARLAEQRYLAELALITLQAPLGATPTVLVAPPRDIDAGPDGAGAMLGDTAGLAWLRPGTVAGLAAGTPADAGEVAEPRDAVLLDPAGLGDVTDAVATRDDLAAAVVGDADAALQAYDSGVARATSVAWRDDPEGFREAARDVRSTMDRLRSRVTLLAPADGTYSLASSDAPLVLTVNNELPFTVQVLLELRVRGNRGLSIGDIGPQILAPGERTTLQVPTQVRQSGGFAVSATLTTPSGGPLGSRVDLQVKSTAYGPISLIITIGAAALLGLLFLRRLVLFVLRRRRAAAAGPAAEDTVVAQPPTRSPV